MRLEVKDVCFSYQDGELKKEIFNGASCEFLDKKFYCITVHLAAVSQRYYHYWVL